jgi:hypothetical protein
MAENTAHVTRYMNSIPPSTNEQRILHSTHQSSGDDLFYPLPGNTNLLDEPTFLGEYVTPFLARFDRVSAAMAHTPRELDITDDPYNLQVEDNVADMMDDIIKPIVRFVCNSILQHEGKGRFRLTTARGLAKPDKVVDT